MKTKYIFIMVALLVISSNCLAQYYSGGHDSLLFDGASNFSYFDKSSCGCTIKILKRKGPVYASYCIKEFGEVCGEPDTSERIIKSKEVPFYLNEILDIDTIRTRNFTGNAFLVLQLNDG